MDVNGNSKDIIINKAIDVSQEPGSPKDAKHNEAAERDAKVNEEDGELMKKNESETEDKLNEDDRASQKADDANDKREASPSHTSEIGDSSKSEESTDPLSDLKDYERKSLVELRSIIEEAILTKTIFKVKKKEQKEELSEKAKSNEDESRTKNEKEKEQQSSEEEKANEYGSVKKGKAVVEDEANEDKEVEIDQNKTLWGVPLLPSKGDKATDTILLKFLRAREFKVNDAFRMLRNTLQWRLENTIDSVLEEDFGTDYDSMTYVTGVDREGHPVCYNLYGVFANDDIYNKTFATAEGRERFLRWRLQLMEKEIQMLDLRPGGVHTLLQINDLKDTPGPSRKDIRAATRKAVDVLQDNYPEFVARNIFINVPFWYYAFSALLSPFLTQRTKSKFVFARSTRVTDTLLKYIAAEEIPVKYGGLKRENDPDFSTKDGVYEVTVKSGSTESIEIPAPKAGSTLVWDLTVLGWEVNYKEEFVPTDESSYTVIVKKGRWIGWQEESIRNSFRNNEPGKVVLTIENGIFKKKRVLYRYKTKNNSSSD